MTEMEENELNRNRIIGDFSVDESEFIQNPLVPRLLKSKISIVLYTNEDTAFNNLNSFLSDLEDLFRKHSN